MAKHDKTLKAIFAKPTLGTIAWKDIENLFKSLGGVVREGEGSRIAILIDGRVANFHRPHPRKEASKGSVESAREFLRSLGHEPK